LKKGIFCCGFCLFDIMIGGFGGVFCIKFLQVIEDEHSADNEKNWSFCFQMVFF